MKDHNGHTVFDKGISANEKKLNKQYQRGFAAKRK